MLLAGALVASGSFDQAREAADEALRRDGADANARLIRAIACAQLGQHGEALADIEGLPESVLSAPYMRLVRIQLLAALGRYGEALALADAEISSDAGGIEIAVWRAQVLAEAGRSDEALTALEELCGQHPERPDLLRFWAELLRGAGRVEEAIAALEAFNGKDPTDVEALKQLAELYTQCGNNDAALVELDRALSLAPGRVDLLLPRASALHGAGRDIAALQSAEQAMQLDTADHQAAGLMGQILDELGRREEAATAYVEAFTRARVTHAELAANYVANVERIVDLLAETEVFDAALRVTDRLRAATPLTGRVAGVRAELLRVMGRYGDAVNQADEAVDSGTDQVWMAGTKGASLIELGRSARALSVIEDALQQSPDYGFGRGIQLRALNQVGRVTDALQVLDAHLSSGEDAEPFATMARTALWNNLGRFAESLRLLEQRVEESRAQDTEVAPDWLVRLGNAYHRLGMIDDAVDNLGRAVEATGPDVQPWALIELADALMRTPRADEAKPFYELAIASSAGQERLLALTESGWALFRLGQIEPTLERFGLALQQSEDPMFFERTRYALINLLVREDVAAETELDELLRRIAGLEDRAYAGGVLADGRHVCAMLRADGTWAHRVDRVAMAESRFQIVDG